VLHEKSLAQSQLIAEIFCSTTLSNASGSLIYVLTESWGRSVDHDSYI
jgi:hypothetical protein